MPGVSSSPGVELQPHDAAAVAGEDRGDARLAQEVGHADDGLARVARRDELAVVGEGALDKLRHHLDVLQAEQHLRLVGVERHLHRLLLLARRRLTSFRARAGMITSVRSETDLGRGRRYTERRKPSAAARVSSRVLHQRVDAGEHGPRVVRRGGEDDLR